MSDARPPSTTHPTERTSSFTFWCWAVAVLVLVVGLGVITVERAACLQKEHTDFTVYREAGRAVLNGTDIYKAQNSRGWRYIYPPPFSILMTPFAKMSVFWGALVWYIISVALTASAVRMSALLVGGPRPFEKYALFLYALPIFLILGWFMSGVTRGQASIMMAWLIIAAVYWHFRGRDIMGASCLAGAILLKVFPVTLLAYFVWRKRWRFVAATFVALVVGGLVLPALVFGWRGNLAYLREWVDVVGKPSMARAEVREQSDLNEQLLDLGKLRNQSLAAVAYRLSNGGPARAVAAVMALIMAAVVVLAARRAQAGSELLIASAAIVWTLLISPVSWSHYSVVLLLPLTVLVAVARGDDDLVSRRLAVVALAVFGVVSLVTICIKSLEFYGLLCWATLGVWATLLTIAVRRARSDQGGSCESRNT